jgi:DNA helicase IV
LGYDTRKDHLKKLYQTISDKNCHVAYEVDKYKHVAMNFHSVKGLEFEQVIAFAKDYKLSDMPSIYNHYVSVTRAKSKLVIVRLNNSSSNCFKENLEKIFLNRGLKLENLVKLG